jgi:bis(5'-nucleosyl)-tetraphosphatase (symmetrical)
MATYFVGDIQGCYAALQALLERCNFMPDHDTLCVCGDLVNRGSDSLATLRFIKALPHKRVVLGNHDLYALLRLYGIERLRSRHDTLDALVQAEDAEDLLHWLRHQPLMHYEPGRFAMVHAGVPPQWSLDEALRHANEVAEVLKSDHPEAFLLSMYGDEPVAWDDALKGNDRLRYTVNALTRMRFVTALGTLDFESKQQHCDRPGFKPWFTWRKDRTTPIFFGHWAALEGVSEPGVVGLDTGCVWGGALTAYRLEDGVFFSSRDQV